MGRGQTQKRVKDGPRGNPNIYEVGIGEAAKEMGGKQLGVWVGGDAGGCKALDSLEEEFLELRAVSNPGPLNRSYFDHLIDSGAWDQLPCSSRSGPCSHLDPLCFCPGQRGTRTHGRGLPCIRAGQALSRPATEESGQTGDIDAFVLLTGISCREPGVSQAFSAVLRGHSRSGGGWESGCPQGPEAGKARVDGR